MAHAKRPMREKDKEYFEEVLSIDRVTRVMSGGRRLSFRATVIVGNKNGKVAIGIGKSNEVMGAIQKAVSRAKKSMLTVPVVKKTIPHPITYKYKSARIMLMPAGSGTGIIAGGAVRKIAELAGITNLLSKIHGTNNKITNAKAMMKALEVLKDKANKLKLDMDKPAKKTFAPKKPGGKQEGKRRPGKKPSTGPKKVEAKKTVEQKAVPAKESK